MAWPDDVPVAPIQSAIYELGDCLSDLTDCLELLGALNQEGIDADKEYAAYVVACATFVAIADELRLLLDQSVVN